MSEHSVGLTEDMLLVCKCGWVSATLPDDVTMQQMMAVVVEHDQSLTMVELLNAT